MTTQPQAYRVEAFNTAKASENKMHVDSVAQRFGFSDGPVPPGPFTDVSAALSPAARFLSAS